MGHAINDYGYVTIDVAVSQCCFILYGYICLLMYLLTDNRRVDVSFTFIER